MRGLNRGRLAEGELWREDYGGYLHSGFARGFVCFAGGDGGGLCDSRTFTLRRAFSDWKKTTLFPNAAPISLASASWLSKPKSAPDRLSADAPASSSLETTSPPLPLAILLTLPSAKYFPSLALLVADSFPVASSHSTATGESGSTKDWQIMGQGCPAGRVPPAFLPPACSTGHPVNKNGLGLWAGRFRLFSEIE